MKMDITVTKKDHVNIGDYSSSEPGVTLTLKDVSIDDFKEAQKNLSALTETIWIEEFISSIDEMGEMVNVKNGVLKYVDNMRKFTNLEELKEETLKKIWEIDKIVI